LREFIDENSGEFFVQVWGNGANFAHRFLYLLHQTSAGCRIPVTTGDS
jgi:hypothetical protein